MTESRGISDRYANNTKNLVSIAIVVRKKI